MRQVIHDRSMTTSRKHRSASFGIDMASSAHLAMVLRDSIYSDKILAVMREYAANAWDANRDNGNGTLPIFVHVPTSMKAELIIRDQGPGLSQEDVFRVYTQYGKSTKRLTNNQVGSLGLGCKSGFAYSDSFTITSRWGGEKRVYLAVLDESDMGQMQLMHAAVYGEFARAYLTDNGQLSGVPSDLISKEEADEDNILLEIISELEDGTLIRSDAVFRESLQGHGYWEEGYAAYVREFTAANLDYQGYLLHVAEGEGSELYTWAVEAADEPLEFEGWLAAQEPEVFPLSFVEWVEEDYWTWTGSCDLPFDSGVEVKIAVKPLDVPSFKWKASKLFQYFEPQPEINIEVREPPNRTDHGFLDENNEGSWIGVMGCVPYRLDLGQVKPELEKAGLWDSLLHIGGGCFFEIGDVQFNASREELKYSETTKMHIVERLRHVVDDYIAQVMASLGQKDLKPWEKRQKAVFLTKRMGLAAPKEFKHWNPLVVKLWGQKNHRGNLTGLPKPLLFTLVGGRDHSLTPQSVEVNTGTTLLIRDDSRALKGYTSLASWDLIVKPTQLALLSSDKTEDGKKAYDLAAVRVELDTYLENAKLTGIPISNISGKHWDCFATARKTRSTGVVRNLVNSKKHTMRTFVFKTDAATRGPKSNHWDIEEEREPQTNDVFVVLSRFQALGPKSPGQEGQRTLSRAPCFYDLFFEDMRMAADLGVEMPGVYGYKTTKAKPVLDKDCVGISYFEWRLNTFGPLLTEHHHHYLACQLYLESVPNWGLEMRCIPARALWLQKQLGQSNPVTLFYARAAKAHRMVQRRKAQGGFTWSRRLREIANHWRATQKLPPHKFPGNTRGQESSQAVVDFVLQYPLVRVNDKAYGNRALLLLVGPDRIQWLKYIKMVDATKENSE